MSTVSVPPEGWLLTFPSGDSGSGKTTLRSHLLSSLLSFSSTPLSSKLSFAAFVFDTLTTTKSITTPTASKAGLFFELQYDGSSTVNPTLIGGKVLDHRLERSRITTVPTGERSFHVLYYLLAGTSPAEKSHLALDNPIDITTTGKRSSLVSHKRWRYLGHPTQMKVGINDSDGFQHFKTALRKLEFPRSEIAEICQILACILHIGQLEFTTGQATTTAPEESGGYSHEGGETVTIVKNKDVLGVVAAFLGLSVDELEASFGYKTKTISRERVTVMLDPRGARENADDLARTLYSLLVAYIIEKINQKVCAQEDAIANTVSIVDFPGFSHIAATNSALDQLLNNAATESLYNYCLQSFFERKAEMLETEEVTVPATSYFDNSDTVRALLKHGGGILSILDDQTRKGRTDVQFLESIRKRFENKNPAIAVSSSKSFVPGSNFATHNSAAAFTVKHFAGEVDYSVHNLIDESSELVSSDLMNLVSSTRSDFVRELFGQDALTVVHHPKERSAILEAQISSKPSRKPSMARRKPGRLSRFEKMESIDDLSAGNKKKGGTMTGIGQGAAGQFLASLDNIKKSLTASNVNSYFIFCLKPNDRRIANQFDNRCVRTQIQTFGIAEISQRLRNADFSVFLPFAEFLGLAEIDSVIVGSDREKCEVVVEEKNWPANEALIGSTGIFLSERCWADVSKISDRIVPSLNNADGADDRFGTLGVSNNAFGDSKVRLLNPNSPDLSPSGTYTFGDETKQGYFGGKEFDARSEAGASAFNSGDMFKNLETREQMAEKSNEKKMEEVDDVVVSGSRKRWLALVYLVTWYIPDFIVQHIGRMKRKDVRSAWREKLAINLFIWTFCLFAIFFIIVMPQLICPKEDVYDPQELSNYNGKKQEAYVAIRGEVFNLNAFVNHHYPWVVPQKQLLNYGGRDVSDLFPVQVSSLCKGVSPEVVLEYRSPNTSGSVTEISKTDTNAQYHDFRYFTHDYRPDWYLKQIQKLRTSYWKGWVGYTPKYIQTLTNKQSKTLVVLDGYILDLTSYINGDRTLKGKPGTNTTSSKAKVDFLDSSVVNLIEQSSGNDITKSFNQLPLSASAKQQQSLCLKNLFLSGKPDMRQSTKCKFANYLILGVTCFLAAVIAFKFFAALQFTKKPTPEALENFIICQVPAYTEDEESLRRAIDSMARMRYDDKRKLLVVICDGMIIGQGNDRPTPRIVLDIFGVPDTVDPEPLSFESLGEGQKQHNMGKIYSGLYETTGHIVPFLVVVKVGKPSEVSRPGNRGKRDSQMVMMRFLNRIHYNLPMAPMELEMYHHIRNIIGVNPTFYEFLMQVDADTVVAPDSATRFVSAFKHDRRVLGVCGETALGNAKASMTTMGQVYEYYISHVLTKAFESLFNTVTCLPGCFSMYRIYSEDTRKPLFVSREVIDCYSEIRVDTLHMKNLLHLGEDRYLTTLLLKFHPRFKTRFLFGAHAWTIAPDSWAVLLSQRRRWINSTVHNLIELTSLNELCGFCCFSMRFIVMVDFISTVASPVTMIYIVYLIVEVILRPKSVPIMAFIILGAIYGLQAIIFILRRKWEMVGWMIIYIFGMPISSFFLPLYSFWHMDDFSWGNTRVTVGEKGRQVVISDEGKFDPSSIPKKKWEDYQAEAWEAQTHMPDDRSEVSGFSYGTHSYHPASFHPGPASEYGFPASRPVSRNDLGRFGGSRYSVAPSEVFGAGDGSVMELADLSHLPSDDSLLAEIRSILETSNLMQVTKKSVKQELERRFNVNLDAKKHYINSGMLMFFPLFLTKY